jgi:hypothetical protein
MLTSQGSFWGRTLSWTAGMDHILTTMITILSTPFDLIEPVEHKKLQGKRIYLRTFERLACVAFCFSNLN